MPNARGKPFCQTVRHLTMEVESLRAHTSWAYNIVSVLEVNHLKKRGMAAALALAADAGYNDIFVV